MFEEIEAPEGDWLRFVGDAQKWWIEDPAPRWTIGGRTVHIDRPKYRAILEKIQPDIVIGDVPSLDLAAPAVMRNEGALPARLRLIMRRNQRSSPWALEQVKLRHGERLVDVVVDSITALCE